MAHPTDHRNTYAESRSGRLEAAPLGGSGLEPLHAAQSIERRSVGLAHTQRLQEELKALKSVPGQRNAQILMKILGALAFHPSFEFGDEEQAF